MTVRRFVVVILLVWLVGLLVGCGENDPTPTVGTFAATDEGDIDDSATAIVIEQPDVPTEPPPTNTPIPTPTPIPLVASVNGSRITEPEFDVKFAQYTLWFPEVAPDGRDVQSYTLDAMITQRIVEQAAEQAGIVVSAETIQNQINATIADNGGEAAHTVWLENSRMTPVSFRNQIADELLMQAMIDYVTVDVPASAEFVRARYIQTNTAESAEAAKAALAEGQSFAAVVQQFSIEPTKADTNGDLGYFFEGMLTSREVEGVAFALQPNQTSDIITVPSGDSTTFFIIQTVAREVRPLNDQQRSGLLEVAFETWLENQRAAAEIEIFRE